MTQTLWKVSIYGKSTIAFRVKVGQLGYRLEAVIGPVKSEQNQMPGNAGGLNGSMQHSSRARTALKTKAKDAG
jgi:hypothetical protein